MDYIIPTPVGDYIDTHGLSDLSQQMLDTLTAKAPTECPISHPHGFEEHRNEIAQRIKTIQYPSGTLTAVTDSIYVYPSKPTPYSIRYDSTYDGSFLCGGSDFRYRGFEDGFDCKHILLLRNAIRCGLIPLPTNDVSVWVADRLPLLVETAMNASFRDSVADELGRDLGRLQTDPYNTSFSACVWNLIGAIEMGEYPDIAVTVPKEFEVATTENFFRHKHVIPL